MEKKNNSNIIIIIIVVIILIVLIVLKNTSKKVVPAPIDVNTVQLQAAVNKDKTTEIKSSIDNIKVEDTTSTELDSVDKELNNL